jgi:hypothetical protein
MRRSKCAAPRNGVQKRPNFGEHPGALVGDVLGNGRPGGGEGEDSNRIGAGQPSKWPFLRPDGGQ